MPAQKKRSPFDKFLFFMLDAGCMWMCGVVLVVCLFFIFILPDLNAKEPEELYSQSLEDAQKSSPLLFCDFEASIYVVTNELPAFASPDLSGEIEIVLLPGTLIEVLDSSYETSTYRGKWLEYEQNDWWKKINAKSINGYNGSLSELWINPSYQFGSSIEHQLCLPIE